MAKHTLRPKAKKLKTFTKADICADLYNKIGYSKKHSADMVDAVFNMLNSQLSSNRHIKLSGFGNFILKDKKARAGRNPQTGKKMTIKKRRVVLFHPSPVLRKMVNSKSRRG